MKWISVERFDKVIFSLQEMTEFWDTYIETTSIRPDSSDTLRLAFCLIHRYEE